ncbi:hypothetical protein [Kribbella sindirgiensis]|nr:hypothetical protein [Kribbella sindirgiensis]
MSLCTWAGDEARERLWPVGEESTDQLAGEAAATAVRVYADLGHR